MGHAPVGRRAADRPWLGPSPAALLTLTDDRPDAALLAADPGTVALVLRFSRTPDTCFDAPTFAESVLAEAAARFVELAGVPKPLPAGLLAFARHASALAAETAARTGVCSPQTAAAVALLAPLGWFAAAEVSPESVEACRGDILAGGDPDECQTRHWGRTHDAIARRLADRWRLPAWVTATLGNLGLPAEVADRLGAPVGLFSVVRDAVAEAEDLFPGFAIVRTVRGTASADAEVPPPTIDAGLLVRLLKSTARGRRAEAAARLARLEADRDALHAELRATVTALPTRVRDAKLSALAELAGGAGHEINNPLAIISGQAQLLLSKEDAPERRAALESVVRQTRRISDIVSELMQFARPKPPALGKFDVAAWLTRAVADLRPAADAKIDVECPPRITAAGDAAQLATAVQAILRNAVEAAPGGCVRVTAEVAGDAVRIAVEDDGPGPDPHEIEHLFDPFFSGRPAGRGRGLGLSVAWQLARINGGRVAFDANGGPTRFLLEIPLATPAAGRLSA